MDKYEKRRAALQALIDGLGRGGISKVAERIDKQPSYVSRMLFPPTKDGFKRIGEDTADVLNAAFPGWLAEEPNIQHGITIDPNRRGYPIISYVQAGAWRDIVDSFPRGGADEYILANSSYGPHTFALRIVGNSMEPEFREGDVVVIDPDVRPDPGNFVVARNDEEAATFKKYRPRGIIDGAEVFELVPLNPDYAVMRSDQQPIQIIGTMVEHTRFRR
jgi:SOS-response transcriptional repressor LexA